MSHQNPSFSDEKAFRLWLRQYDPEDQEPDFLLERLIAGIHLLGIDIYRSSLWLPTAHPELWGTQIVWSRDKGFETFRRNHSITSTPTFLNTPGQEVYEQRKNLQWKLDVDANALPYPLLREVKEEGGTDYIMIPFLTENVFEMPWITFSTKQAGGFSEKQSETLKGLCEIFSWKTRVIIQKIASKSLLSVYLGENAAQKVIEGKFKRGTGERIKSVIWFCDLRDFTQLGNTYNDEELVAILDQYFECISKPIEANGGEILKFIGDAVLAIFPTRENIKSTCSNALNAAEQALENLAQWSQTPERPNLQSGIALHLGEVLYGNIGGSSRLDFTVIGSAVNIASRVESLCKTTYPILATKAFQECVDCDKMLTIGEKELRGMKDPFEIFTLKKYLNV